MSASFRDIRALVFDFDGTLVDASVPICIAFNAALERSGRGALPESRIRGMIGRPLRDMFPMAEPGLAPDTIDLLITYYREAFRPIAPRLSKPMPGLERMLNHFHPGTKLGIATSRMSDGAQQILGAMNCLDRFDVIVGLQDVEHAKPHPEPVLKVLAALEVQPEQAVMVGDIPEDMLAGKSAGAHAVGMVSTLYGPDQLIAAGADAVIESLDELITMVDR
jgi:pyrophosphatase PpaX